MKSQALLVANDPRFSHWLVECLGGEVDVHMARATSGLPDMAGASLAFIEIEDDRPDYGAHLIDQLVERHPDLPVFAVGTSAPSAVVLSAVRAGARDYFLLDVDGAELAARVGRVVRRGKSAASPSSAAQLICCLSAQANPRLGFVAGHLALAALETASASERVLLIDIAAPTGSSLVYFNINQTYSVVDALSDVYRCDQTLIDTAFARHSSGLYVLGLSDELLRCPVLNEEDLLALVETLRSYFTTIVIACDGSVPSGALARLVGLATRSMVVTDQSILRSRHNKHLIKMLRMDGAPLERTGLVIDSYRRRLGLEPDNLSELLDLPVLGTLGGQGVKHIHAMNAGESMFTMAPRDGFCQDVRRLMGIAQGHDSEPAGLLERLLG